MARQRNEPDAEEPREEQPEEEEPDEPDEELEERSREPAFWFCRCWCLCAIRFGCCLARAVTLRDVYRCLKLYRRCLRRCFRPLYCEITKPGEQACADEQYFPGPNVVGVEIVGTATGAFCDHYEIEWKPAGAAG